MKKKHVNEVWYRHTLLKISRIMRLTLGLLLTLIVQGWAIDSYSQKAVVNLDLKNVDIIKVLDEIEKQTDYYFLFNYEQIHTDKKIDIKLSNSKIDEVLSKILEGTGLNYSIKNRQIVISKDTSGGLNEQFSSSSSQQPKSVSGKVTDSSGASLP
ncbi:STN domain-containing protein, partial [bacterium]|nr:STN domain-containing protein [bacterium]